MPREATEIRLIRETLEGVLHPSAASTIFFDALDQRGGALPADFREALDLVQGPLASVLRARLGTTSAESLIEELEFLLNGLDPDSSQPGDGRRGDITTKSLLLREEVLPMYIIAQTKTFGDRLLAALGPNLISAIHVSDLAKLKSRLKLVEPAFVLVEGSDFPAIEPVDLARALKAMPSHVVKAVWGPDLPYAMSLIDAAHRVGLSLTPFDRREGLEPLTDVLRSRRG